MYKKDKMAQDQLALVSDCSTLIHQSFLTQTNMSPMSI